MSQAVVVLNRPQANALKWVCRKCPGSLSPPAATLRSLQERGLIESAKDPALPFQPTPLGHATMSRYEAAHPSHRIPSEAKRQETRP